MKVVVTDKHGISSEREKKFMTLNSPYITGLELDKNLFIDGEKIKGNVTFNDRDHDKLLFLFYKVGPTIIPIDLEIKSDGSNGQFKEFEFYPQLNFVSNAVVAEFFLASMAKLDDYVNEDGSFTEPLMFSKTVKKPLKKTFKPSFTLDDLPKFYYEPDEDIIVSGTIAADGYATIYLMMYNLMTWEADEVDKITFDGCTQEPKKFTGERFEVHLKYDRNAYGFYVICEDGNGYQDDYMPAFAILIRSPISITNVVPKKVTYFNKDTFDATLTCKQNDEGRTLYVYYRINDGEILLFRPDYDTSKTRTISIDISCKIPYSAVGDTKIELAISDKFTYSWGTGYTIGVPPEFSTIFTTSFRVSPPPVFTATLTNDYLYKRGDEAIFSIYIVDDETVTLKYIFDGLTIDSEEIALYGSQFENKRSLTIPSTATYGSHRIKVVVEDNFGFSMSSTDEIILVVNKPTLNSIEFSKPYGIKGSPITLSGAFYDIDADKQIYIYVQFGDKKPAKYSTKITSNGKGDQTFSFGLDINDEIPYGMNDVKVWISSSYEVDKENHAYYSSYPKFAKLSVTFQPTMTVKIPSKTVYQDGEKITIAGEVNSYTDVNLKYSIDTTKLTEVSSVKMDSTPQQFRFSITIPEGFKQGTYTFGVYAVDSHGLETE
ncbi:hypothetical protein TVAG_310890 [Trichomonas vaginalis G3]|uniref:Bap-like n=1 Tax=Trichomonas vaginalis (strain ATCC PRA-98 / G3) TaxID=412133 RepID=A2FHU4_TRIV3|nr:hypothetical protein TVAGG3_0780470 [Trichomonas vaginalis G3]EAX95517.1 hypothetical protein TVAG_310890 [Trichomonas vaginalis G3]KAI5495008.1 hypothetical protein TVAGG3_0780470 [Trichomonas vaginalis G3]|eukprot:XP_001308447.1 hypothetical protein [Trichomonas vaginalis G3]